METIKEEKKADLEQLLNSLIEKGWKPFGESRIEEINRAEQYVGNWNWCCWGGAMQKRKSTRQLVSKESGLWKFVCENGMVKKSREDFRWTNDFQLDYIEFNQTDFQYWLLESSLEDESELEQFLLSNIKVDVKGD